MGQAGDVLAERYELAERLGRGGMAEVFRARDKTLGREVAVKILAAERARDEGFIARFRREARSAAALNHRNVVGVHDTGDDDGEYYIVMELVEGSNLDEVIKREERLSPERSIAIAQGICSALEAAHAQNIVHRDIKPANVMFDREGVVKVADFGLARAAADATQTTTVYGSAPYMSPEQARGEEADPRTDIYALGCVLYAMLTGRPPFEADSALAIVYQHMNAPPTPPSEIVGGVPEDLEKVILHALEKDPDDRYQEVADLHEDLNRVAAGKAPLLGAADADRTQLMGDDGATRAMGGAVGATQATRVITDEEAAPTPAGPPPRGRTTRSGSRMLGTVLLVAAAIIALIVALLLIRGGELFPPPDEIEAPEEVEEEPEPDPAPEPETEPEPEPEPEPEEEGPPDDRGPPDEPPGLEEEEEEVLVPHLDAGRESGADPDSADA